MASLFRGLFGNTPAPAARQLRTPADLRQGDIIQFRFLPQELLSGRRFQIAEVFTYSYGLERYPEMTLVGDDNTRLFLAVADPREGDFLSLTLRIQRPEVEALFTLEAFAQLFAPKDHPLELVRMREPARLAGWTAPRYLQRVDALKGTCHAGDFRDPRQMITSRGEGLDFYLLIADDDQHTIEVEVYDGGETEVAVGLRLPPAAIEEMWPGAQKN